MRKNFTHFYISNFFSGSGYFFLKHLSLECIKKKTSLISYFLKNKNHWTKSMTFQANWFSAFAFIFPNKYDFFIHLLRNNPKRIIRTLLSGHFLVIFRIITINNHFSNFYCLLAMQTLILDPSRDLKMLGLKHSIKE